MKMTRVGWPMLLALALMLLCAQAVSADTFEYDGQTITYYPELGETQDSITEILDYIYEGPPPPPGWPVIDTPSAPAYQNQGSSDAKAEPTYSFEGQEYWLWT